jgi:hypothetical protein
MASSSSRRHLVRPSPQVPWDVSVTSLVPSNIHKEIEAAGGSVASFASCGDYKALFSQQGRIYVWNTTSAAAAVHILHHPLFLKPNQTLRLSISSSSSQNNKDVYVYGWNDTLGFLAVWKMHAKDRPSLVPRLPNAKLKIGDLKGTVVSLQASAANVYLGAATGGLWHCRVSTMPMVLSVQQCTRSTSLWNRVLGASGTPVSPIQSILVNSSSSSSTTTVTQCGAVETWKEVEGTSTTKGMLVCLLEDELEKVIDDGFDGIEVLQASIASTATTTTLDVICKLLRPKRARIYWMRVELGGTAEGVLVQQPAWLNRFHGTVTCSGLVTCDNGMAYAAFSYPGDDTTPVTILALSEQQQQEIDLPQQEAPSLIGMGKDVETHGCTIVTTPGLVLRARWMQLQPTVMAAAASSVSDEQVQTVARHLSTTFWKYYQTQQLQLSPFVLSTSSDVSIMEAAILKVARQLQQEGGGASSQNPMEWHLSLVRMLQQAEFYKNLTSAARWTLLGIGQELAIYPVLVNNTLFSRELPPYGLATKVTQVQRHVLDHAPSREWTTVLAQLLQGASQYREEHAVPTYDVLNNPHSLWTHELKDVLLVQLKHPETINTTTLETIVKAALRVHQEVDSKDYSLVKSLGIGLIRTELKNDKLAHDLSLEYAYYEGLCQLSLDNPVEYSLEPILTANKWDDFGSFSLFWFTQQERFDQVLIYGRLIPDTFGALVKDKLPEYQWVHALRQGKYDVCSDALYNINATGQNIEDTEWHLSMAKLAAKVHDLEGRSGGPSVEGEAMDVDHVTDKKRRKLIDSKLDLIGAQLELMDEHQGKEMPLQTPDYLLHLTLEKLQAATERDAIVKYAMVGLVICQNDDMDGIATVWSHVIAKELPTKWSVWIRGEAPSRHVLVNDTVFGQLWKQVQEQPVDVHAAMQYDPAVLEEKVMRKLATLDRGGAVELKRLLRSVTTIALVAQGMLVDSN